jgi:hypothetical protein
MKKICLLPLAILFAFEGHAASTIDTTNQYAWGANVGWTNWRPDFDSTNTEGVIVGEFGCTGYIYSANVGWINMGGGSPANHIQYQNNSATDFGVNTSVDPTQPGYLILRGYAYGGNIGWINFEATGNPRLSLFTGTLSGYAYSANCGWINLNDINGKVQTDHLAMGVDSNGNGIADAWEYLYFGGLLSAGAENSHPNGSSMTLLQYYQDGMNPSITSVDLRITAFSTNIGHTLSSLTFNSTTARLYNIETTTSLVTPVTWTDSGLGLVAPDAGTSTTRSVNGASSAPLFYHVKTSRPLP